MKIFDDCILFASGGRFGSKDLQPAINLLKSNFHQVKYNPIKASGYFAGSRMARIEQFREALKEAAQGHGINWLMPVRGGYGTIDIVPFFDEYRFPKETVLSGFSDISVLLNTHQCDELFFPVYGMNAIASFSGDVSPLSRQHIINIINDFENFNYSDSVFEKMTIINSGRVNSEIFGGCLSVLISLIGTPYFPDLKNKILFLEDVSEPVYKIDRMLRQLEMIGVLDRIGGVLAGEFINCPSQYDVTVEDVLEKYFNRRDYPVVAGFPMGHGSLQVPLKFKWEVELSALSGKVKIIYKT